MPKQCVEAGLQNDAQVIASSFSRAAKKYDKEANVQSECLLELYSYIDTSERYSEALDIGTGTASAFIKALNHYPALQSTQWQLSDIAAAMLEHAQAQLATTTFADNTSTIISDAHALTFADESFDLISSNYCLQWADLSTSFNEIFRCLKKGGTAYIALPVQDTFHELNRAWQSIDKQQHVSQFVDHRELVDLAEQAGFAVKRANKMRKLEYFEDLTSLLRHIRDMGANRVKGRKHTPRLSRNHLQQLSMAYERKQTEQARSLLPLTWVSGLYVLRKPS